ncbi:acetoin dehydrogenase dihydrolipoyllysine-residue acetyltransferase subunit [Paracoccus pacificus]|uniref:Acetoin dehydrogenase dihydrolipoyllysine-residue acetyltransferase subunit n=1 Tax=Paracoccus pacificus TaxID=1463598 RepID=A0ABW4R4V5_9RHOB
MATEVILPKVDMDMTTGRISRWLVKDGATVAKGAVLFEIETDKAAMEIDAPADGTIRITAPETGVEIAVGEPVAWIFAEGEAPAEPSPAAAAAAPRTTGAADAPAEVTAVAGPAAPAQAEPATPAQAEPAVTARTGTRATPLARRLARESGLDLAAVAGSGPHGRVQRADIEAAVLAGATSAPPAASFRCVGRPDAAPAPTARLAAGLLNAVWLRQGAGVPVVMIHGFGSELSAWRPFLAEVPADRAVLALDLPAHGKSVTRDVAGFDDLVTQAEDTLTESGITSAHLVGHSLGGAVAAALAGGLRLEVQSLLLISPAGLGPEMSPFVENFARATEAAAVAGWLREVVHDPASLSDAFVRTVARTRADGTQALAQTRLASALFGGGVPSFSIRPALAQNACPTRIVFGLEDRVFPWRQVLGLPGSIALHLFQQTGHMPQVEQREAVGRILRQMLN